MKFVLFLAAISAIYLVEARSKGACWPEHALCLRDSDCCSRDCNRSPKYYYGRCAVTKKQDQKVDELVNLILTLYYQRQSGLSKKIEAAVPLRIDDDHDDYRLRIDDDLHDDHDHEHEFMLKNLEQNLHHLHEHLHEHH